MRFAWKERAVNHFERVYITVKLPTKMMSLNVSGTAEAAVCGPTEGIISQ
jgi:hypothetical protein